LRHLVAAPWHTAIYQPVHWIYLGAVGLVTFGTREQDWLYNESHRRHIVMDSPVVLAILMFAGLLFISLSNTFIYFRF